MRNQPIICCWFRRKENQTKPSLVPVNNGRVLSLTGKNKPRQEHTLLGLFAFRVLLGQQTRFKQAQSDFVLLGGGCIQAFPHKSRQKTQPSIHSRRMDSMQALISVLAQTHILRPLTHIGLPLRLHSSLRPHHAGISVCRTYARLLP